MLESYEQQIAKLQQQLAEAQQASDTQADEIREQVGPGPS